MVNHMLEIVVDYNFLQKKISINFNFNFIY